MDVISGEKFKFHPPKDTDEQRPEKYWLEDFRNFVNSCCLFVGHNLLGYDVFYMNKLLGTNIKVGQVIDTLVMSRLFRPVSPMSEYIAMFHKQGLDTRMGGHSLDAWGSRLGYPKLSFNDFSKYTDTMLTYCMNDTEVNIKIFEKLLVESVGFSLECIELENKMSWYLSRQERAGFHLDKDAALRLYKETSILANQKVKKLQELFPPLPKITREGWEAKRTKDGSLSKVAKRIIDEHTEDPLKDIERVREDVYNLYQFQEFNPGSGKQIAERLMALGWKPTKFTDKGNPKTDQKSLGDAIEELLKDNPDKQDLKELRDYSIIVDRRGKAEKWLELVEEDGRVHGHINPIGAGTHRCSHYNDNMANIPSVSTKKATREEIGEVAFGQLQRKIKGLKKFDKFDDNKVLLHSNDNEIEYALTGLEGGFGWDCRACWTHSHPDTCIVGCDASGIQLRALAHYMNDAMYIKELLEGDIHEVNREAAGIDTRPKAKTFIYAWLLGAGDLKIGQIVGLQEGEEEQLISEGSKTLAYRGKSVVETYIEKLRKQNIKATRNIVALCLKGAKVKKQFLERTPALKRLRQEEIPKATQKGFLLGLDGRKLWIPSEHLAMSLYLQGFEAVIMKKSLEIYHESLMYDHRINFKQVAFVHDEFQIECLRSDADVVGQVVANSIREAGEHFKTNCPLDGEYQVGRSWAETH